MNRPGTLIWGRNVAAPTCTHPACVNLRQIRSQAFAAGRMDLVMTAERGLRLCPDQPGPEYLP